MVSDENPARPYRIHPWGTIGRVTAYEYRIVDCRRRSTTRLAAMISHRTHLRRFPFLVSGCQAQASVRARTSASPRPLSAPTKSSSFDGSSHGCGSASEAPMRNTPSRQRRRRAAGPSVWRTALETSSAARSSAVSAWPGAVNGSLGGRVRACALVLIDAARDAPAVPDNTGVRSLRVLRYR